MRAPLVSNGLRWSVAPNGLESFLFFSWLEVSEREVTDSDSMLGNGNPISVIVIILLYDHLKQATFQVQLVFVTSSPLEQCLALREEKSTKNVKLL